MEINPETLLNYLGAATFGALMCCAWMSVSNMRELANTKRSVVRIHERVNVAIDAADRVLRSPHTPEQIRIPLLLMLQGLYSDGTAQWIKQLLASSEERPADKELSAALAKFRFEQPDLANDLDEAVFALTEIGVPMRLTWEKAISKTTAEAQSPARSMNKIAVGANSLGLHHAVA